MTDLLDYIIDNKTAKRREIYRNGTLIAVCDKALTSPLLKYFSGATEPFGAHPDAAPKKPPTVTRDERKAPR